MNGSRQPGGKFRKNSFIEKRYVCPVLDIPGSFEPPFEIEHPEQRHGNSKHQGNYERVAPP